VSLFEVTKNFVNKRTNRNVNQRASGSVDPIQLLNNHCSCSTTTVTDGSHTVLSRLQLMEKSDQNSRSRASQGVSQGNGSSKRVDPSILQTEDLMNS
jgi:hypothetical protein